MGRRLPCKKIPIVWGPSHSRRRRGNKQQPINMNIATNESRHIVKQTIRRLMDYENKYNFVLLPIDIFSKGTKRTTRRTCT